MSFSKSKVSRFGDKPETLTQRISVTEFKPSSRGSAKSQGSQKGLANTSFTVAGCVQGGTEDKTAGDVLGTRKKCRTAAVKHSCLSSKIGRPNFVKKTKSKVFKNAEIEGVHQKDSLSTIESSKSGPPTSRIPSVPISPRSSSLGTSRAQSFVGALGTTNKSPDFQKRNLETQFNLKSKRLGILKKDLLEKQKPAVELYKTMINLRNKFKEIEGKELQLEELKIVDYHDVKLMDEKQKEEEKEKLRFYKSKLQASPTIFMELCRQILDDKCRILDKIFDDECQWDQDGLMKSIQSYKEETAKLESSIESRLREEDGKLREYINKWYQIAKVHIGDGTDPTYIACDLEKKLQETERKMKQAIAELQVEKSKNHNDLFDKNVLLEKDLKIIRDKYHELTKTLEEERTKALCQKERQSMFEHNMKTAKDRVKETETMKQDLEYQLDKLTETIKKKEEEWQSKENYLEAKHNAYEQAIHNHKQEIEKLERERHSADVRINELREEFQAKQEEFLEKNQQLEFELNEIKSQKANIEKDYDALRVKSVNSEVQEHMYSRGKKKLEYEDTAAKSTGEIALWKELTDTKSALKLAEEKIAIYAQEKTRFMDTINENYKEYDDSAVCMASHLMQKEELISTLLLQNKQLQESVVETQNEYERKCVKMKEMECKLKELNEQLFEEDVNTEKEIYELHTKLEYEVTKNINLEQKLDTANNDNQNVKEMILDYENLLKIRDALLTMMQEKRMITEDENKSLKDYIIHMRDQLNLLSIDKSKKENEIKSLVMQLEEKTSYILTIEERVASLESSVQEIKHKRVNVQEQICNADDELRVTRDKISRLNKRENRQQFINHAQNLYTHEDIRFRKKLRSCLTLKNSETGKSSNRSHSAHACPLDNSRMRYSYSLKMCASATNNN